MRPHNNSDTIYFHFIIAHYHTGMYFFLYTAMALMDVPGMGAEEIGRRAMKIASDTCIYTK
jgi:ATP-dependent protease HslVU (ClpYQ) peptidase subunit